MKFQKIFSMLGIDLEKIAFFKTKEMFYFKHRKWYDKRESKENMTIKWEIVLKVHMMKKGLWSEQCNIKTAILFP